MTQKRTSLLAELKLGEKITGEVVKIWAATRNEDTTEGRGKRIDSSYHLTQEDAQIAASGIDVGGQDGQASSRIVIKLKDGRYLLGAKPISIKSDPGARERLRAQALAKLTPSELATLKTYAV